jgi:hypothetical protein
MLTVSDIPVSRALCLVSRLPAELGPLECFDVSRPCPCRGPIFAIGHFFFIARISSRKSRFRKLAGGTRPDTDLRAVRRYAAVSSMSKPLHIPVTDELAQLSRTPYTSRDVDAAALGLPGVDAGVVDDNSPRRQFIQ